MGILIDVEMLIQSVKFDRKCPKLPAGGFLEFLSLDPIIKPKKVLEVFTKFKLFYISLIFGQSPHVTSVLHCLNVCVHVCVPHSPVYLGVHMYVEACGDIGQPFFLFFGTWFLIVLELTK